MDDYCDCILSKNSFNYTDDINKGICRLSTQSFQQLNIRIGWIVEIELRFFNLNELLDSQIILCTTWSDLSNELSNKDIYAILDNFIRKDDKTNIHNLFNYNNIRCKVLKSFPPRFISTLYFKCDTTLNVDERTNLPYLFSGIAVCNGINIKLLKYDNSIVVSKISDLQCGIIRPNTTFIQEKSSNVSIMSNLNNDLVIGCTDTVYEIIRQVIIPLCRTNFPNCVTNGILLVGQPGTGKTYAVNAVKNICSSYCKINTVEVNIPNLLIEDEPIKVLNNIFKTSDNFTTEFSYQTKVINNINSSPLRKTFDKDQKISPVKLYKNFSNNKVSSNIIDENSTELTIYILDEIDSLGNSTNQNEKQLIIKSFLLNWFDMKSKVLLNDKESHYCCVIGTTNRVQDVDQCLRRGGRFEKEIQVITNKSDRKLMLHKLLTVVCTNLSESEISDLSSYYAESTGGYVIADLIALINKAHELYKIKLTDGISSSDILNWRSSIAEACKTILPSSLRGITAAIPTLSYDDVIGCVEAKKVLHRILSIVDPTKRELRKRFNITSMGGALLYGPPGNSKTRLVMASAAAHNLPVISLTSADIYSAYVGDAEAEIRKAFGIARQASPCIIFFDELDAIVTDRGNTNSNGNSSSNVESRILATMLNEMDGISGGAGENEIIVLAATNRIDAIDKALLRKGRFQHLLYIPSPSLDECKELVKYFSKKFHIIDTIAISALTDKIKYGMSGADIENLCKEEKMNEIRNIIETDKIK